MSMNNNILSEEEIKLGERDVGDGIFTRFISSSPDEWDAIEKEDTFAMEIRLTDKTGGDMAHWRPEQILAQINARNAEMGEMGSRFTFTWSRADDKLLFRAEYVKG